MSGIEDEFFGHGEGGAVDRLRVGLEPEGEESGGLLGGCVGCFGYIEEVVCYSFCCSSIGHVLVEVEGVVDGM